MNQEFNNILDVICTQDPRYKQDAYEFVMEALSFTQKKYQRSKHVTGVELLEGMKELLLSKYGSMTISVLQFWGIDKTEDFGHIVFNLVENKVLSKSAEDDIEHFRNGYDFQKAFHADYRQQLEKKISRMRSF